MSDLFVLPTGCTPEVDPYNYALHVCYMGPRNEQGTMGGAVTGFIPHYQLSRAGYWNSHVRPFQCRLHRWDAYEEALSMANAHVDQYRMNGRAWAESHAARS